MAVTIIVSGGRAPTTDPDGIAHRLGPDRLRRKRVGAPAEIVSLALFKQMRGPK